MFTYNGHLFCVSKTLWANWFGGGTYWYDTIHPRWCCNKIPPEHEELVSLSFAWNLEKKYADMELEEYLIRLGFGSPLSYWAYFKYLVKFIFYE